MSGSTEQTLRAKLGAAGFDRLGVVSPATWDQLAPAPLQARRLLPSVRAVWILGSGGRSFFDAYEAAMGAGPALGGDPLDGYTEACVAETIGAVEAAGATARAVFAHRAEEGAYADFVALGRAAGLGWPSRLGLLLHPEVGPWLSLRAAILVDPCGSLAELGGLVEPTPSLPGEGPCPSCPAPCVAACPGGALRELAFDVAACAANRRVDPTCRSRCAARRGCVIGPEAGYSAAAEAHHMAAAARAMGLEV